MRRPSPKRRAFSKLSRARAFGTGYPRAQRAVASTSQRSPSSRWRGRRIRRLAASPRRSNAGAAARATACAVDVQRRVPGGSRRARARSPLSPATSATAIADAPTAHVVRSPAHGLGPIGRRRAPVERVGERRDARRPARPPRPAGCRRRAGRSAGVPASAGAVGGRDGVPAARPGDAVDAGLAARLAVPAGRLGREAAAAAARRPSDSRPSSASRRVERLRRRRRPAARGVSVRRSPWCARGGAARRCAVRGSASPGARASRRAGRSTPSCRATPRARAASTPS